MRNQPGNELEAKRKSKLDFAALAQPWYRAADRAEREGKSVLAVFFRSEAARMEEKAQP